MKRFLQLVLFMFWCSSTIAQNTVGLLRYEAEEVASGLNLFFPHNQSRTYLMNNCGEVVHTWSMSDTMRPGNAVYLLENGQLLRCSRPNNITEDVIWAGGGGQIVDLVNWEGNINARFELNNDSFRLHHDVEPLPNGNVLMIVWERIVEEEALAAGRRPDLLPSQEIWSEKIMEWNPTLDSVVWEWRVWDHLIQDFDAEQSNYGSVSLNLEKININYDEHDGHPDWLHINAIAYNPVLDQIVLSVPYFNEFWIIDHSTTLEEARSGMGGGYNRGGQLLYRWGNPNTYQSNGDTTQYLFFQHDVQWLNPSATPNDEDFGKILLFNNRYNENFSVGMVIHTPIDYENKSYAIDSTGFVIEGPEKIIRLPEDSPKDQSSGLSSIQRLSNGNWLIFYGRWGYAVELNQENEIVWEYVVPLKGGIPVEQGIELASNNNLTFRFNRYPLDYPAFQNRDLESGNPLEINPNNTLCSSTPVKDRVVDLVDFKLVPNPVADFFQFKISGNKKLEFVKLYNASGKLEREWHGAGLELHSFDVEFLTSGIYFIQTNLGSQPLLIHK